jgi:glycosyltransferase involved in cell wall biosynthesis
MRVLYVQYTNPGAYPPLVRGARLLAESGADVCMLGVQAAGLEALDVNPHPNVDVRMMPAGSHAWQLKAHYARYAAWVARDGARWRPDWIYASDVLAAPAALALATITGAPVLYHEHDAPSLEHESRAYRICLAARRRLTQQADIVVTPNAQRSRHLSEMAGGREVITAWNCPPRPTVTPSRTASDGTLRVMYRGSINADRLPVTVVDAIAMTPGSHLDIAGYETAGSRGHIERLLTRATELGAADRVRALGTLPGPALEANCAGCDLGLALMPMDTRDENMRHMTGASNKVFEYLTCGVVPLVSSLPDWRATFVEAGYALECDPREPQSIASVLANAARDGARLRAMAEQGWKRLQRDWNYETQFAPVMEALWARAGGAQRATTALSPREAQCAS